MASVTVTGQVGLLSTSLVEAWIGNAGTADHSWLDHAVINSQGASFHCSQISPDTGSGNGSFVITVILNVRITGALNINWVWN